MNSTPTLLSLGKYCVRHILSMCDEPTLYVLEHTPELVPTSMVVETYSTYGPNKRHTNPELMTVYAVRNNYFNLVKWFVDNGQAWRGTCSFYAARDNRLDMLEWAEERRFIFDSVCDGAAKGGHLDLLQWSVFAGYTTGILTYIIAVKRGDIDILKFLYSVWHTSDSRLCTEAAKRGHLDVLQFLRSPILNTQSGKSYPCEWDEDVCAEAARWGHADLLKWSVSNECPYDKVECLKVTSEPDLYQWIVEYM